MSATLGGGLGALTIKVEYELDPVNLGDLAVTAAEGGIGHWAVIVGDGYHPDRWTDQTVDPDFVFYRIQYEDPEDDGDLEEDITPAVLARGIAQAVEAGLLTGEQVLDIGAQDADVADLVIQYALLGEVTFS